MRISNSTSKKNPKKKSNKKNKNFLILLSGFFLFLLVLYFIETPSEKSTAISLSELAEKINQEQVEKIEIDGQKANIELANNEKKYVQKEEGAELTASLEALGAEKDKLSKVDYQAKESNIWSLIAINVLPFAIPLLLIGVLFWLAAKQIQKGNFQALNFGRSRARFLDPKSKTKEGKVSFKDVAGLKEAKEELKEVVDFLKNPTKFIKLGAKIPKGVLLIGAPGTGKTLLARAVSNEAEVPFFILSGSEFVEMFVGVGASRVRDLFNNAKKHSPSIIFIDEIDAVGRQRGAGLGGSHDEREQTLNQILTEMDGFDNKTNVIVMAATNRPDVLDPALLRPGRFDRRVTVELPDLVDRAETLKLHAKGKPIDKNVDFKQLGQRTVGFSGADLANLINEAAILAARKNKKTINMDHCREAIEKVMLGPSKKSRIISKKEKKLTAYHEAGHAVVAYHSENSDPVHKVTIIPRGMAGGYTLTPPQKDIKFKSQKTFLDEMSVILGGYIVEKEILGDITTGASNDLEKVTAIARQLVRTYGMSRLGPISYNKKNDDLVFLGKEFREHQEYGEKTANEIDNEVERLISETVNRTQKTINKHKNQIKLVANALMEKEVLEKDEFENLMKYGKISLDQEDKNDSNNLEPERQKKGLIVDTPKLNLYPKPA